MRKFVRTALLMTLSLVVAGSVVAYAAGAFGLGPRGSTCYCGTLGRLSGYLELSVEQQQELLKTQHEFASGIQDLELELELKRLELRQLWDAEELNEVAISQKSGEIAALQVRLQEARKSLQERERQLLTPDQQQKLDELTTGQTERSRTAKRLHEHAKTLARSRVGRQGASTGMRCFGIGFGTRLKDRPGL